jgi:hypothetical protein
MNMTVVECRFSFDKMNVFSFAYGNGRASYDTELMEMVKKVSIGFYDMHVALAPWNRLARNARKTVIMSVIASFRKFCAP